MIARILVATDFSPASEPALERALEVAIATHAEVTLMNAWSAPGYVSPDGAPGVPDATEIAKRKNESSDAIEALRARLARPGIRLVARSVEGPPSETVAQLAADEGFDLVVIGTHGRTGIRRFLLGSVAERIVRIAHTPVMTVHAAPPVPAAR